MKPKSLVIFQTAMALFFCQSVFAQIGITSIVTASSNLPTSDIILDRKGAGIRNSFADLSNRWDSINTNFKLVFNAGIADSVSISDINVASIGLATRLPFNAIAKVRRVANAEITHTQDHYSFWATTLSAPAPTDNSGTFLLDAPEITSMEAALVSNNINTGYNNIFQNNSLNVHYGNIERIDYIIPDGFTLAIGSDLSKIGFTIYDRGIGNSFKIGAIKSINTTKDPIDFITPILDVNASDFGNDLLATESSYIVFQNDALYSGCESRPSIKMSDNLRGVFISLADLGYVQGQTVYGFSLFASDISTSNGAAYLQDYSNFPTNTSDANMLDLANSIGIFSFNQVVLSSSTVLSASLQNNKVLLQWNTASFTDVNKVFLQKASGDLVYNNVTEIGINQSSFIDESIRANVSYYRLKIIKHNGEVKYSNIQLVHSKISNTQIFPTVASDMLYMSSNTIVANKPVSISMYNIDGKMVQSFTKMGSSTMNIEVNALQKGMYIISVMQNNDVIIRQKFIKN